MGILQDGVSFTVPDDIQPAPLLEIASYLDAPMTFYPERDSAKETLPAALWSCLFFPDSRVVVEVAYHDTRQGQMKMVFADFPFPKKQPLFSLPRPSEKCTGYCVRTLFPCLFSEFFGLPETWLDTPAGTPGGDAIRASVLRCFPCMESLVGQDGDGIALPSGRVVKW